MGHMSGASKPTRSVRLRTPSPSKRASILRAARELVTGVGFRDTQMNAVAETAGVALGTLYRNFPSKAELMVEVVADVAQREVDAVAKVATENGTAAERLSASAWLFASRALLGRKLAHALVAEPVEPEIESARLKYRRKLARVFEGIIEQGIRDGEFPVQDVQASAACIVGSLFEGLVGPLALDSLSTAERQRQAKAIVAFCLRGTSGRMA
ncbi:TetR/AcrR family transcriptional regulator [Bradyrhizobium sp. SRL28]|uniref:TetR/AcrR family transcriptional regulator n=1 Tax=Bradyrhizobium sp. SRL28 TaxID=2836178 RepID=UPI0027DF2559|nr:TetR/AcrR family transcriptional regulator [Bradyrhizobium sp. SRL28]